MISLVPSVRVLVGVLLLASVAIPLVAGPARGADPPAQPAQAGGAVSARLLKRFIGQGGDNYHCFDLEYENTSESPRWLISQAHRLDREFEIGALQGPVHIYGAIQRDAKSRSGIKLSLIGEGPVYFSLKAVLVPGKGKVRLEDHVLEAKDKRNQMLVLEAEGIVINGDTPFEKWLPADPTCDAEVIFHQWNRQESFKEKEIESLLAKSPIKSLEFKNVIKHEVLFTAAEDSARRDKPAEKSDER